MRIKMEKDAKTKRRIKQRQARKKRARGSMTIADVGVIATLLALALGGFYTLMKMHDPAGTARALSTSTLFTLESWQQNARNHYLENIEKGYEVEEAKRQLKRLDWNEQIVEAQKQNLGIQRAPASE